MAAYWKLPCENFDPGVAFPKDSDIEQYIREHWPSETEYAKARLYGRIATYQMGGLPGNDLSKLFLPYKGYVDLFNGTVVFLYGIRELHSNRRNRLAIPPGYHRVNNLELPSLESEELDEEILDLFMYCFNGERPRMLPVFQLYHDEVVHSGMKMNDAELCFLSEIEYAIMQCQPFLDSRSVDFTIALVNKATNLQVLILQGLNVPDECGTLDLDYFCEQLANCRPFWSKFRLLKIVPGFLEKQWRI